MIIKTTTTLKDAAMGEIDTDKLSDVDAMILEKADDLRSLCIKSGRQCWLMVENIGIGGAHHYSNFWTLSGIGCQGDITKDEVAFKNQIQALNNLLYNVDQFVKNITFNTVGLSRKGDMPTESEN